MRRSAVEVIMTVSRVHAMLAIAAIATAGAYAGTALVNEPACVEIADRDPAWLSPLAARYATDGFRLERQRGVSQCSGEGGRMSCLLTDPGRFRVTTGGERKTFSAPPLAKLRISSDGRSIRCAPVKGV
ncbi:hypothetical protein G5B46_02155 [Caulobacter sp. 602-2]|uniref:DUF3617 family protein n=1 Tax=Caulobacter sp. 602-2 TaxID=2710887 RepID=A0A6G4QSA5_9CAUL|nr:hypothetical protein [Caulobacter sp. 602-2]NGM48402.1 hypothetical protein [Caulobacter sp. 602-2]